MQRYFGTKKDNEIILNNDDLYHIKTVMRMKDNDNIIVVSDNIPYLCELSNVKDDIKIKIINTIDQKKDNMPKVRLIIPLLKEQKMDLILQKATELGVKEIILYESKRSVVKETRLDKKIIRWQKILKEASEQSHRIDIPSIYGIKKIKELDLDGVKLVCSTKEDKKNIQNILKTTSICDTINIVVGPEGGLDNIEEEQLNKQGYISTTLGSRIMRVETVPIFVLSIINYQYME